MALARMRTPREAARYIQQLDGESAIGEWWIRRAIKTGLLPYTRSGNRYLISLDVLERLLTDQQQVMVPVPDRQPGKVRRISER